MVTNDSSFEPEISPDEITFRAAIDAVEQGNLAEARNLLTGLLKNNQTRVEYWVWLSAAMESARERLYCLQTAYRLDPQNAEVKRGLRLMGALPPEEALTPFPMLHPRPWEGKAALAEDAERPTGWKALTAHPIFRVAAVLVIGLALLGLTVGGFAMSGSLRPQRTRRALTLTPTPTVFVTPRPGELQPLSDIIKETYTPTLVYALTPHSGANSDVYRGVLSAYKGQNWEMMALMMEQIATNEPGSVDAVYFMGEASRLAGNYQKALEYYQQAIKINANFAPSYLGRARANLALKPRSDVKADLDAAIAYDPNFWEAYLERGLFLLKKNDFPGAMLDLRRAKAMAPDSPLVQLALARIELAQNHPAEALAAAQKAKELDPELAETYLLLGMAYRANGETEKALETLEFYLKYSPDNAEAFVFLGASYLNQGQPEKALTALDQAIRLEKTPEAYTWRGETHLTLKNFEQAKADFRQALRLDPASFEAGLGVARADQAMDDFGNAYVALQEIEKLVNTDVRKARFWYYRALSLRDQNFPDEAYNDWMSILTLPAEAVDPQMRAEVEALALAYRSPTPPPFSPTPRVTATPTPSQTRQPSPSPSLTATRMPSVTPTP